MTTTSNFVQLRKLLKIFKSEFATKPNGNQWMNQLRNIIKSGNQNKNQKLNLTDIIIYWEANRNHKEMMERYWPTSSLTAEEKLKRTANTVGFNLPKQGSPLSDLERNASKVENAAAEKIFAKASG